MILYDESLYDIYSQINMQERSLWNRNAKIVKFGKLLLGTMVIFGLLFPDFVWNYDTVTVTDRDGKDITDELSGEEIFEGIYSADHLEFTISWFN